MKEKANLGWAAFLVLALLVGLAVVFKPNNLGAPREPNYTPEPGAPVGPAPGPVAPPTPTPEPSPSAGPVTGQRFTYSGKDTRGQTTWELHADSVVLKDAEKRVEADRVKCTFFGSNRKAVAHMVARGAVLNTTNDNLFFVGEVVATNPPGDRLTVHKLTYDGARKKFFGSGGIKVTRATSVLTGDRMIADPKLREVRISGHVQAFLHSLARANPTDVPLPGPTGPPRR